MQNTEHKKFKILLYYKYQKIMEPAAFVAEHKLFCAAQHLLGRIIIAEEGINGTCAGALENIDAYKHYLHTMPGFEDICFKEQTIDFIPFKKLQIRQRKEIVASGMEWLDTAKGGKHITPEEVNKLLEQNSKNDSIGDSIADSIGNSIVFFDVRNEIESKIGHFKNAITPKIRFFRELPNVIEQYQHLKNKKVVLYCTGGIRCEKASALFLQKGFKNVYQIEGGIYNYCSQYPDGHFEGTCFVFDERVQIGFHKERENENRIIQNKEIPEEKIISHCDFCSTRSNRIVDDERNNGHHLVVCCEECDKKLDISRIRYTKKRRKNSIIPVFY